jgi:hypothetical protein
MTADSGSCGCPFSTADCNDNCKQQIPVSTAGRCAGLFHMTCECLKGDDWISLANKCLDSAYYFFSK